MSIFSIIYKLLIMLQWLGLFDMYKMDDLRDYVHYYVRLGLPRWQTKMILNSIYEKIDNDPVWRTESEFKSLLSPTELSVYKCNDVPESVYMSTLVNSLTMRGNDG